MNNDNVSFPFTVPVFFLEIFILVAVFVGQPILEYKQKLDEKLNAALFESYAHPRLIIDEVNMHCWLVHETLGVLARWERCEVNHYETNLTCENKHEPSTCDLKSPPIDIEIPKDATGTE